MIVRGPGIKPGIVCKTPVLGTDLFVTWCALAGVKEKLQTQQPVRSGDCGRIRPVRAAEKHLTGNGRRP
jgi:arylsulfatase A-like enzyme